MPRVLFQDYRLNKLNSILEKTENFGFKKELEIIKNKISKLKRNDNE